MSGCVLRASGKHLRAPEFLAKHAFPHTRAWEDSFNTVLSDCDGDELEGQVEEAVAFLQEHGEMVRALLAIPTVQVSLDFGLWQTDTITQSVSFPANLVRVAGALGVGLGISLYPVAP